MSALAETSPPDADQSAFDAEAVHLVERDVDRVLRAVELLRHVLEHVLDGEVEAVAGFGIAKLLADEFVLREVVGGKADHAIDDRDVVGHSHIRAPVARVYRPVFVGLWRASMITSDSETGGDSRSHQSPI